MRFSVPVLRAVSLGISVLAFHAVTLADELSDAIAETDWLDPGWRLEQIIARCKASRTPDSRNSVLQAQCALKKLPTDWQKIEPGDDRRLEAGEVPRGISPLGSHPEA